MSDFLLSVAYKQLINRNELFIFEKKLIIEPTNTQSLIISLIRDSLINFKLISGLNNLGLNADDYHTYLGDTIFKLMGLEGHKQSDILFQKVYLANAQKVRHISFATSTKELDKLSKEIYNELLLAKGMVE